MTGLAAISARNGREPDSPLPPAPRAALAAAVSHSSNPRRVNTSRIRVTRTAWTISYAWLARKASWSRTRARPPPASSRRPRRKARQGCCGFGPVDRLEHQREEGECGGRDDERRPERGASRQDRPGGEEQRHGRGGEEAAPQVVEDLPSRDHRQPVALESATGGHEREQPGQDLPVSPGPAVLPARVGEDARRVVVHHLHVGDQRGPRVQALEEIVREERVVRHPSGQGGGEGVHLVETLAGEGPLAEEVLVGVRDRRGVGVHGGLAGEDAREAGAGRAGRGDADPGLEDPVAFGHPAAGRVEAGPVERMGDDPDQLPGGVPGEPGVGVEGDAVAHAGEDRELADLHREARVGRAAQEPVQLLELAALPLPPHPHALSRVPLARPVEQEEPIPSPVPQAGVQPVDALASRREDGGILGHLRLGRVGEVSQDGEVDAGVEVPEGEHLDVLQEILHAGHAREQGRDDHQGPRVLRDPPLEVESREATRRCDAGGQALDEGDGELARGEEQEERHRDQRPARSTCDAGVGDPGGDQPPGHEGDGRQVEERGPGEGDAAKAFQEARAPGDVHLQVPPALPDEVVADVSGAGAGALDLGRFSRALHRAERDAHLGLPGGLGQLLHGLSIAVPAQELHPAVHAGRVALQDPLDEAHRLHELGPVDLGAESQAGDGVRHRHLGRRLALVLAADRLLGGVTSLRHVRVEVAPEGGEARAVLPDPVEQLHDVRGVERAGQRRQGALPGRVDPRHVAVGRTPRRPGLQGLLREAPQVLDECELEHAGPGPELADGQGSDGLEPVEEAGQLLAVEAAVAVADELHRQCVDPGVAGQVAGGELGQLPVVAAREVLPDHADLRVHQVVVVEDPLAGGSDELAPVHVGGQRAVGLPEDQGVVVEAGEDAAGHAPRRVHREPGGQRAGALLEPLDAEQLVPERQGVEDLGHEGTDPLGVDPGRRPRFPACDPS